MPAKNTDITINPYQSDVPMVQVPPQEFQDATSGKPLLGQFGGHHGSGGLAIGDAILKGFLQGHEYKAQKKAEEAKASIAAADAATSAAWQKYQDALAEASGNVNDPKAKAAYDAYTGVFAQGKAVKAKYVIPDEPKKGEKKRKDEHAGMLGGIREFMAANPHLVPQLALASMQPNAPGMTPQTKAINEQEQLNAQNLKLGGLEVDEQTRLANARKVYDKYSGLNDEQFEKLPQAEQVAFRSARDTLFPPRMTGAPKLYKLPDGSMDYFIPRQEPEGAQPYLTPTQRGEGKPGSKEWYFTQFAKANKTTPDDLPQNVKDALEQRWNYLQARNTSSSTTVSPGIDNTVTTSRHTAAPPPMPAGWSDPMFPEAAPTGTPKKSPRGMQRPPSVRAAADENPKSKGGMTRPPAAKGEERISARRAQITLQTNTEKSRRVQAAQQKLTTALANNAKKFSEDPAEREKQDRLAQQAFDAEMKATNDWYDQQVRAIGGTPGSENRRKSSGPIRYYQGQAYQQDENGEWHLQRVARVQ